jgi:hypothetical protein
MMTLCFEKFKGDETVAYYSIVMKLVLFCSWLTTQCIFVSLKSHSYTEKNHTELVRVLRESARIIVMLTLAVVVCLFSIFYISLRKIYRRKTGALILMVGQLFFFFELLRYIWIWRKAKYFPSRLDFCGSTQFTSKYYINPNVFNDRSSNCFCYEFIFLEYNYSNNYL